MTSERHEREARALLQHIRPETEHAHSCHDGCQRCAGAPCVHCDEGAIDGPGVYVHAEYEPIRPLWQSAPPHDGTTPAMRRQR